MLAIREIAPARRAGNCAGPPRSAKGFCLVKVKRQARVDFFDLFDLTKHGLLLDIPAGAGDESARLARMGFRVVSADLFPPSRVGVSAERWICADCNQPLPFR